MQSRVLVMAIKVNTKRQNAQRHKYNHKTHKLDLGKKTYVKCTKYSTLDLNQRASNNSSDGLPSSLLK